MDPFIILMFEGVFQLLIALFFSIFMNPFENFINVQKQSTKSRFILLIFLYILEFVFRIIINVYKIYCNVIYSPMARSLIDYLLNPILNIIYFFIKGDFYQNYLYFIIIEIICLVISIFGCVFNEYIILYCCGLEHETKDVIADRANDLDNIYKIENKELTDINDDISKDDNSDSETDVHNTAI